jgi:regulator of protease activity HflC (stomatin/prohibitin superfamily)
MEHCVEVFDHYKTAMGYKALAHRFRLAIDLPEPFTLEDVLDALSGSIESIESKEKAERDGRRTKVKNSGECAAAEAAAEGVAGAPEASREGAAEGKVGVLREGAAKHQHSAVVKRACRETEKILEMLRKVNRKKRRSIGRSMGALDEILHEKLKLLHIPRSA